MPLIAEYMPPPLWFFALLFAPLWVPAVVFSVLAAVTVKKRRDDR